jgi:hypothetical protein
MDVSREEEQRMGLASFHVLKQQYKDQILPENHEVPDTRHNTQDRLMKDVDVAATQLVLAVRRIGRRIIEQTDLQGLHWEFLVSPRSSSLTVAHARSHAHAHTRTRAHRSFSRTR